MYTLIPSILASTVVAGLISSFVSYRLKFLDFRNEYYKIIIRKRLDCYVQVEKVVLLLQPFIVAENAKTKFHRIFETWSGIDDFKTELRAAIYNGLWITKPTLQILRNMETMFIKMDNNYDIEHHDDSVMAGETYYLELEKLKNDLEDACRYDILHLHRIT